MIRIDSTHLDMMVTMKNVELFKVIAGYLIKGSCPAISDRLEIDDTVEYKGYVDPGTELINLYVGLNQIEKNFDEIRKNNGRIENEVISFIRVTKNSNGKYDSKQTRMSVDSFKNLIAKVQSIMTSNDLNSIESLKEYRKNFDSASEEAKTLDTYIDFYAEHAFTFVLHKYDIIINDERRKIKNWSFYDWNDIDLRTKYELCTEFKILI